MVAKPKPPTRVQRSGRGHSYFLDGERVRGVTTILDDGIPKNLQKWAAERVANFVIDGLDVAPNPEGRDRIVADRLVRNALDWNATRPKPAPVGGELLPRSALLDILPAIRFKDRDEAAGRGTEVHKLAEKLNAGEKVTVPPAIKGHVESYIRFLEEWRPDNVITEGTVVHTAWRYMGTFDLLGDFPGAFPDGPFAGDPIGTMLVDVKTSRSGIYAETGLQLQAYRFADKLLGAAGELVDMPPVDHVAAIHLRPDGYSVRVADVTDDPATDSTFRTFLHAMAVGAFMDWRDGPAASLFSDSLTRPDTEEEA